MHQNYQGKNKFRNPYINGYRALSIVAVMLNHINPNIFPNGYFGVDLFFFISGYSISSMLLNGKSNITGASILLFYYNRIKKLLPILIFSVVIFTILLIMITEEKTEAKLLIKNAVYGILGLQNLFLYFTGYNYFDVNAKNPFLHLWSIAIEFQLYIIYPVILLCIIKYGLSRVKILSIFAFLSILIYLYNYSNTDYNFYLIQSRIFEFIIGGLLFLIGGISKNKNLHKLLSYVFFIVIIIVLFGQISFSQNLRIPLILILFLQIYFAPQKNNLIEKLMDNYLIISIALLSYPLYIIHFPLLFFVKYTIGLNIITIIIYSISLFIFSYILFLLQKYFIKIDGKKIFLVLSSLLLILISLYLFIYSKNNLYIGDINRSSEAKTYLSKNQNEDLIFIQRSCLMTPQLVGLPKKIIDKKFIKYCLENKNKNKNKIILVGDSFTTVIAPMLYKFAIDNGFSFNLLYGYGRPFPIDLNNSKIGDGIKYNENINLIKKSILDSLNPGDLLIIRNYWNNKQYLSENDYLNLGKSLDLELNYLSSSAKSRGAELLIIGTNPEGYQPEVCKNKQWFNKLQHGQCSRFNAKSIESNTKGFLVDDYFNNLAQNLKINYIDIDSLLCSESKTTCINELDGKSIYSDKHHINEQSYEVIKPPIIAVVKKLLNL